VRAFRDLDFPLDHRQQLEEWLALTDDFDCRRKQRRSRSLAPGFEASAPDAVSIEKLDKRQIPTAL
jgi:hypothetical protein